MRYFSLILFALALAAPFAMRRALLPPTAHGGGPNERLVIITPHNQDIRNEFAPAFAAWHRAHYGVGVELDFRVPGGTSDVKRQLAATYRAAAGRDQPLPANFSADISMVWGGGDYFIDQELKPLGILQPIHLSPTMLQEFHAAFPHPTLAGVKLYDGTTSPAGEPTPLWIGVCLSSFGICYNPDVYHSLQMPEPSAVQGWQALTDPRLVDFVALADPAHSGSSAVAYQMVIQHRMAQAETMLLAKSARLKSLSKAKLAQDPQYRAAIAAGWKQGMAELLKIAANARYFTDSSSLVPNDVSRGEAAAGMAIDFYARVTEEAVGPDRLRYVAPIGATAITPDPVAILRGTQGKQLELANHFIEFLLSPQGQRLWILRPGAAGGPIERSLRRMPIRPDVYADRTGWADQIDPYATANGFNERGTWMALFGDSRPIWVAAWIDARDSLHDAYRKILRMPDLHRRAAMVDRLADLPITMADVENLRAQRKQIEAAGGELEIWQARQQIEWAARFRAHYRAVAAEASSPRGGP